MHEHEHEHEAQQAAAQARIEEQIKSIFKRLDEQKQMIESIHKLATSVELLASAQKSTEKKVDALTHEVEEIKYKPAKRWDLVITALISAVMAFLLAEFGLK